MRAARTDNTAKALRTYAEELGFTVVVINGVIDCLLCWGDTVFIVDYKSKGGTLTADQAKLVAKGVRIRFISTPLQLDQLRAEVTGWSKNS